MGIGSITPVGFSSRPNSPRAPSRQRRLLPWPCIVATPRRLRRRQHKAAHGFSGYAGAVLDLLHSVARRRLPAVKRTAAMPGVSACKVKTVPPAALRIHSAATRPTSCRVPSSFLLHSVGRTRPRQTRCAGLPVKYKTGLRFASVGLNPPGCSLRSTAHRRAGVNRKRLNITAHYPK